MPRRIPIRTLLTGVALAAAGLPDAVRQAGSTRSTSFPAQIGTWSMAAGKPVIQRAPGEDSIDAVHGSGTLPYAPSNELGRYRTLGAPLTIGCQGIAFRQDRAARREAVTDLWIATGEQVAANPPRHERGPA